MCDQLEAAEMRRQKEKKSNLTFEAELARNMEIPQPPVLGSHCVDSNHNLLDV